MKRTLAVLALLFSAIFASAQATNHSVTLSWVASSDAGATYNVYRASGICQSPLQPMTKLANTSNLTYFDDTVTVGTYCYYVTATLNGAESPYSSSGTNFVAPSVLPAAPTTITVVVK